MEQQGVRKYPRVRVGFPVECAAGRKKFRARVTMLGGGGLFLNFEDPLPIDTVVALRFRAARHLPFMEAKARVRYSLPGQGVALEFVEISPENQNLLLRLIHHKATDRRKFPRARLAAQVNSKKLFSLAMARDVSVGGMFIETKEPLPLGSQMTVRFNLEDDGPSVLAAAEVTYAVPKMGMGIKFLRLDPQNRKRIELYVIQHPEPAQPASQGIPKT